MNSNIENGPSATKTPAYVRYATFTSALDALRNHGIPASGRIDKTIWASQSGSVQGQLILSFKFLGLIDAQNRVLPTLPPVVAANSASERRPLLKKIIEDKYQDIISRDLTTISPGQLQEAFRKFEINGSTLISATRFFVKACAELGIPIAKRFSEKTRASGPRKKRAGNPTKRGESVSSHAGNRELGQVNGHTSWEAQLLSKFPAFDPAWSDDLKAKWFEGFGRLMESRP